MATNKRKNISIQEKVDIIHELERGDTNSQVCKKYSLSKSTVSTFWKNKDSILSALETNAPNSKKIKTCQKSDVDQALLLWFKVQRDAGYPINGPILKIQAEKFAEQLGHENFTWSNGWLDRFKNRNNIVYAKISGEAFSANTDAATEWTKSVWPELKKGFKKEDIYNADETGLFYNLTPEMTFKFRNEKCVGGKKLEIV